MMPPLVSVVLCTYNRATVLPKALQSLVTQSLESSEYEIVVVDNASTDDTRKVVKIFQTRWLSHAVILVSEPTQGLGYARNTGCKHARGHYLAFIDDDCLASEDWLENLVDCYKHIRPRPCSVGGLILPRYDEPKPIWFKDSYETDTWGDQPRFLKKGESFTGCNMSFRREVIEGFGGFDVDLGMKGDRLALAEETRLFKKIWSTAHESCNFYYTPRAVVYHTIDPYKMTVGYQLKRAFTAGQVSYAMSEREPLSRKCTLFFGSIALVLIQSAVALTRIRPRRNWRNWAIEELYSVASHFGRFLAFFDVKFAFRQRSIEPQIPPSRIEHHSSYAP